MRHSVHAFGVKRKKRGKTALSPSMGAVARSVCWVRAMYTTRSRARQERALSDRTRPGHLRVGIGGVDVNFMETVSV